MEESYQIELILAGIGIPFLLFGIVFHYRHQQLLKSGITAVGTVVDLVKSDHTDNNVALGTTYYPVVVFTTRHGREIRQKMNFGRYPCPYITGDKVEILYLLEKPSRCAISSEKGNTRVPQIFMWIGFTLTIGSALSFVIRSLLSY